MRTKKAATHGQSQSSSLCVGHVSEHQVAAMIAFCLGVKALLITPTFLILDLAGGAWIAVAVSLGVALVGLFGWLKWSRLTPGSGVLSALQRTLGRPLGVAVCALLMFCFLIAISFSMRLFAGGAVIGLLPQFPIEILLVVLISASAYSAWLGLESVARAATFYLGPTIISLIIVMLAGSKGHDARNLLPLFGQEPATVLLEGIKRAGLWGLLSTFVALKPYVRSESDLAKGTSKGLLIAGIALAVTVVTILSFFPYPSGARLAHPMGIMARSVYLGRFLQRLEAIFVFTWFFASALQSSFVYFVLLALLSEVAGTKTYRPFVPALASLSFGISALPVSIFRAGQLLEMWFFRTFGNALIVLGWALYVVALARGQKPLPHSGGGGGDGGAGKTGTDGSVSGQKHST